jgi:hypothetical protein
MADASTNRFGLIDEQVLKNIRATQRQALDVIQAQKPGVEAGSFAVGRSLGGLLKKGLGAAGILKDAELDNAKAISAAQKRAETVVRSRPDEVRSDSPFGRQEEMQRELIAELEAVGQHSAADTVRSQMINTLTQAAEFEKLETENQTAQVTLQQEKAVAAALREEGANRDELSRLMNLQQSLDITDPVQAAQFDRIGKRLDKLVAITGTTEFDIPFDKVTVRRVDANLQSTVSALDGFLEAKASFDPRFLRLGSKIKNFAVRMADIAGLDIDQTTKDELAEFAQFRQVTSTNLNAYIKAITGAQMSNPEAIRLAQDVPTKNDSPAEYERKLTVVVERLAAVRDRALQGLAAADDADEFRRIMSTPLSEFRKTDNQKDNDTRDALKRSVLERALAPLQPQQPAG